MSASPSGHMAPDLQQCAQIVVNVPAYRLELHSPSGCHTFPVAVGERSRRTPLGDFVIKHVTWRTRLSCICQEETLEGAAHGLVHIPFQDPIAIHGIANKHALQSTTTPGCIQMAKLDAIKLGSILLAGRPADLRRTLPADVPVTIELPTPASLHIVYELVEVRDDALLVHHDIYGLSDDLETSIHTALKSAGIEDVHPTFFDAITEVAAESSLAIPLRQILRKHAHATVEVG